MRVGISTIGFMPGECGGTETYVRNLWEQLQIVDGSNFYQLICAKKHQYLFPTTSRNFSFRYLDFSRGTYRWLIRGVLKKATGLDVLGATLNKGDIDLIHHPFTILNPLKLKIPSVLTFWDMQQEFYPQFFTSRELKLREASYRPSVKRAKRIIVSSEFTRKCLVEKYGAEEEKIDLVYTGYGSGYRVIEDSTLLESVRERYQLNKPFLFYPEIGRAHV